MNLSLFVTPVYHSAFLQSKRAPYVDVIGHVEAIDKDTSRVIWARALV